MHLLALGVTPSASWGGAVCDEAGDNYQRGACCECGRPGDGGGGAVACAGGDGLGDGERGAAEQRPPGPLGSPPRDQDAAGVDEADVAVADGSGPDAVQGFAGDQHRHDADCEAQQLAGRAVGEGCGGEQERDGDGGCPAGSA